MIEYTLLNELMSKLKVYCGQDKFYGQFKIGQYDKEKNRAPFPIFAERRHIIFALDHMGILMCLIGKATVLKFYNS